MLTPEERRLQELWSAYRGAERTTQSAGPTKKKAKRTTKLQNTFDKNLRGVPGGGHGGTAGIIKMIAAQHTGTRTLSHDGQRELTVEKSRRNCNTTQGSYIRTVVA